MLTVRFIVPLTVEPCLVTTVGLSVDRMQCHGILLTEDQLNELPSSSCALEDVGTPGEEREETIHIHDEVRMLRVCMWEQCCILHG